jgi:hypothetical protein
MTIGRAKGIPITYAAVYFFFNMFERQCWKLWDLW